MPRPRRRATKATGMTTAIAVLAPEERPVEEAAAPVGLAELVRAAGVEEVVVGEDVADAATGMMVVDTGLVLTDVMTTVTGFVSVTPLLTADCVTTEVTIFVVGGSDEAEMIEVTIFVVLGSTVVVESWAETMEEETAAATEEEMAEAREEEAAAALLDAMDVTAADVSAEELILSGNGNNMDKKLMQRREMMVCTYSWSLTWLEAGKREGPGDMRAVSGRKGEGYSMRGMCWACPIIQELISLHAISILDSRK